MSVVWSRAAEEDWRRLSLTDAETVARAVEQWDLTGGGLVHAAGPGEYRLFVDRFVIVFFFAEGVMHIAQVRNA
jgi:hypothetical protein